MTKITGHCRCGQASYEVSQTPFNVGYCHCSDCRERTSSPCTSFMMVDKAAMECSGKTDSYKDKGGSGAYLDIHRCSECGSVLFMDVYALKNVVAIPSATLEDQSLFKPTSHYWVSSKLPWFEIKDDLEQRPGPPRIPRELLNI